MKHSPIRLCIEHEENNQPGRYCFTNTIIFRETLNIIMDTLQKQTLKENHLS